MAIICLIAVWRPRFCPTVCSRGSEAYGSLGFGLLTGAFTPETSFVEWDWRSRDNAFGLPLFESENFLKELRVVERLKELADEYNKSVPQLAIAWLLSNPAVAVGLVGMRNEHELKENVAVADWRLTEVDRAEIDRVLPRRMCQRMWMWSRLPKPLPPHTVSQSKHHTTRIESNSDKSTIATSN